MVVISLAFIVVSALYATSSSCKSVKKVGKVLKITYIDIMNFDGSDNPIKDVDKDIVIVNCGETQMVTVFEVIVVFAVLVFFLYVNSITLAQDVSKTKGSKKKVSVSSSETNYYSK